MASHREPSVIEKNFGSKGFCCMEQLMHVVKFGAPMDVGEGDDVHAALSYGKHQALTFGDRWSRCRWQSVNSDTAVQVEPACKSAIVMESLMQRIFGSREAGRGSSDVFIKMDEHM